MHRVAAIRDLDISEAPRGALARGLGRSYGDCAQNAGGTVFDLTSFDGIDIDPNTGVLRADGGTAVSSILELSVPQGWFLPVTPGTKHVTVGGAVAADIHGKNHHRDGGIADHITAMDLFTAGGSTKVLEPGTREFRATAGGLGLTGVVTSVTLQMIPIETAKVTVDTQRTPDLDTLMAAMTDGDDAYRYSVAWIDLMATGSATGRGVLTRGDHAPATAVEGTNPLAYQGSSSVSMPDHFPSGLLNRGTVRAFNEAWYLKAPKTRVRELQSIDKFFYPLDMFADWNRMYGKRGFLQYQFAVPDAASETVRNIVKAISSARYPTFLAVLKRFGPGSGLLSFPIKGWTLALDLPIGIPGLADTLSRFDEQVVEAGGRVYLAKDSRLRPEHFHAMYPEYTEWRDIRDKMDPLGLWRSDLARRLDLI